MMILTDERRHAASLLFSKVLWGSQRRWPQPHHAGAPLGGPGYLTAAVFNVFVDLPRARQLFWCSKCTAGNKGKCFCLGNLSEKTAAQPGKIHLGQTIPPVHGLHHSLPCTLVSLHCWSSGHWHLKAGGIGTWQPTSSALHPGTL